jgi:hypothetical protein
MALSEATINKIKVLIYEKKKDEAEAVLIAEAGLSPDEAIGYIERMSDSLATASAEKDKPKSNKTAAFVVMGIGLVMWGLAVYFFIEKNSQLANSYLTTGVVVDYIVGDGLAPVIAYEIEGIAYRYVSNVYSTPPPYELNETVEIYVSQDDPNSIIINSFINKWLIVTIFASFGMVLDLIGLLLLKLKSSAQSSTIDFFDSEEDRMTALDD